MQQLVLKSRDRKGYQDGSTRSSNFKLHLKEPIQGTWRVKTVTIPNSIYSVTSSNNTLFWQTGADYTGTIPVGNYTGETLATAVALVLNTVGADTYVVSYSATTGKLTFTCDANMSWMFYAENAGTPSADRLLGWPAAGDAADNTHIPSATATEAPDMISLGNPLSLGVQIQQCSAIGYQTGSQTTAEPRTGDLLIPFLAQSGYFNFTEASDTNVQYVKFANNSSYINVKVTDTDTGSEVELNGADWEMHWQRASAPYLKSQMRVDTARKRQRT
jgi:hypothetical protein